MLSFAIAVGFRDCGLFQVQIDQVAFHHLGKSACKSANVGPDSLMQLAFQIAYHRLTGKFVATYESCSTVINFVATIILTLFHLT